MRARSFLLVAALPVALVVGDAACVSDPTPAPTTAGALGQPCFPNGTCAGGLTCTLVGSNAQCEPGSDGAAESAAQCGLAPTPPPFPCAGQVACFDGAATATCVADPNACASQADAATPAPVAHGCFSEKDCGAGDVCCLQDGASFATDLCPGTLDFTSSPSACGATLSSGSGRCTKGNSPGDLGDQVLCASSAACPAGQACWPVRLNAPATLQGKVLGLCK